MDAIIKQETDSDVEIIEPGILQDHFQTRKHRLINALATCHQKIPKKWECFQMFIKDVLKLYLGTDLVRSVWIELSAADQMMKKGSLFDTVEISDGEDTNENLKPNSKENCKNTVEVIGKSVEFSSSRQEGKKFVNVESSNGKDIPEKAKSFCKKTLKNTLIVKNNPVETNFFTRNESNKLVGIVEINSDGDLQHHENIKSSNDKMLKNTIEVKNEHAESSSLSKQENIELVNIVEISDDEDEIKRLSSVNSELKMFSSTVPIQSCREEEITSQALLNRSFTVPKVQKRKPKRSRNSLPESMSEEEAEALREKLILDKIIELELPQVIKRFMENNALNPCLLKSPKKRKKS